MNGLAANFHAELRARLDGRAAACAPARCTLNTWEAVYFDVRDGDSAGAGRAAAGSASSGSCSTTAGSADAATTTPGLGDWHADPDGCPTASRAGRRRHAPGMQFGLWVEPEMVNPDSDLSRAHPDWALPTRPGAAATARNQQVLDIARPDATNACSDRLDTLARRATTSTTSSGTTTATSSSRSPGRGSPPRVRAQTLALYRLLDELRAAIRGSRSKLLGRRRTRRPRHPAATDRVWACDCIDALSRVDIQRGCCSSFRPRSWARISAARRRTPQVAATRWRSAPRSRCRGTWESNSTRATLEAATAASWRLGSRCTSQHRDVIHGRRVWKGEPATAGLAAFGDEAAQELLLLVYRVKPTTHRYAPPLRLPMLDTGARYHVEQVVPSIEAAKAAVQTTAPLFDACAKAARLRRRVARRGRPADSARHAETSFIVRLKRS